MEEFRVQVVAIFMQCTSESLIIEELRGQSVASLIQRTDKSLIVEEFRVSAGSDFDAAHERELDY